MTKLMTINENMMLRQLWPSPWYKSWKNICSFKAWSEKVEVWQSQMIFVNNRGEVKWHSSKIAANQQSRGSLKIGEETGIWFMAPEGVGFNDAILRRFRRRRLCNFDCSAEHWILFFMNLNFKLIWFISQNAVIQIKRHIKIYRPAHYWKIGYSTLQCRFIR